MENVTGIHIDSAVIADMIFESELRLCIVPTDSLAAFENEPTKII